MQRFDVPTDKLVEGTVIVDSGVAELTRLQASGAAYLKVP
jgi:intracellular sulfur oxidation DsrE/DsrF family protein